MGQIQTSQTQTTQSVQQMMRKAPATQQTERQAKAPAANADKLSAQSPNATTGSLPKESLRFFFIADNHSRSELFEDFIKLANQEDPDLIVEGGDFVHDGTEPEIKRAYTTRQQLESPVYMVTGNHDAELRGPFSEAPPHIPPFQSFDQKGVHFILLDNENETLSEEQFQQLEADLKANQGKPTFLAMHVPPKLSKEPLTVTLGKKIPLNFASPMMREPEQVKRLHNLLKEYGVKAVLAGHTHFPDEVVEDGIRYITAGSSGGLNPTPGLDKEFLEIQVKGDQVSVERRQLKAETNVLTYAAEALDFYQDLNHFNHQKLGWDDFYPSANINYSGGVRYVSTDRGTSLAPTAHLQFERIGPTGKGSAFAALSVSAGPRDIGAQLGLGYKHALIGDYNRGVFVSGSVTGNGGYLHGQASGGIGFKAGVGGQYNNLTLELGQEWSTNYSAQTLTAGYRF